MIRTDLFNIATSGVNASNRLLHTTSNNIANVNTEGYVRERTVFDNHSLGGVGEGKTERVISIFAQNQLRRDKTSVGELEAFTQKASALDNLLASEANSLSNGLSKFFASIQTAADDPTNIASRQTVLGEAKALLSRMRSMSEFMTNKEEELNLEFTSNVERANGLIKNIGDLNKAILVARGNGGGDEPTALLNERDKAIDNLSEIMSIEVRENQYGSAIVNLSGGDSLVLEDGSFNILELGGDADLTFKQLQLTSGSGSKNTTINIKEENLGGILGGLFRFRDEILGPAQRDIGQIGLAFADAVNTQNGLGMDMDMELGGDIFTQPEVQAFNYAGTAGNLSVIGRVEAGRGAELTDADYKITVTAETAGVPTAITVEPLNADGTHRKDTAGNDVSYSVSLTGTGYQSLPGGIEVDFQSSSFSAGDEFLLQPTKASVDDLSMATERAEDLALASPIRVEPDNNNLGDAQVRVSSVTNSTVDPALGQEASAFNGSNGLHAPGSGPGGVFGAPTEIVFTSATDFEVRDASGSVITTVTNVADYNNLLAEAEANGASPPWPAAFSALDDYPGYDFSLNGVPAAGDRFSIGYNTDGINDNTNAVALAELQDEGLVQLSTNSANQPRTLHDAYSSVVGRVGEETATAEVSLQAAEAMKAQSQNWFDSVSGVSLDEEAANLIRYQQSYAAAARILSTAQQLFDTILSAAR